MNKSSVHIILSRALLLFFVTGQFALYAHQHHFKYSLEICRVPKSAGSHQIILEKCALCDQMQHAPVNWDQTPQYHYILTPAIRLFEAAQHYYKANSLVHADGLSPPVLV